LFDVAKLMTDPPGALLKIRLCALWKLLANRIRWITFELACFRTRLT